jgi:hypothetical protein
MTRRAAIAAGVILLAACAGLTSPAISESPDGSPFEVVDEVAEIGCGEPVDLRGPDGRRVNLTGLWTLREDMSGPSWNIRQLGSCMFAVELVDTSPPEYYSVICDGTMGTDYAITGRCIDFRQGFGQPDWGREYFLIEFDDNGQVELIRCLDRDVPATCEAPIVPWEPPT